MIYVVKGRKGPDSPVYVVEPLQRTGRRRALHRNLLLPCPYLLEEPEVGESNLKEKNSGNKTKRRTGRQRTSKDDTYPADTDSSGEEQYHMWTAVRHADLPLNAEAKEFCPRSEMPRDRPEVAFTPEEHFEEERVEERHGVEEKSDAPAVESENQQSDAETWRGRPKRVRQPRRVYTYDQLGQPMFQQLKTCPVGMRKHKYFYLIYFFFYILILDATEPRQLKGKYLLFKLYFHFSYISFILFGLRFFVLFCFVVSTGVPRRSAYARRPGQK